MAEPLAFQARPNTIDGVYGQKHLIGEGKLLRRMIESGEFDEILREVNASKAVNDIIEDTSQVQILPKEITEAVENGSAYDTVDVQPMIPYPELTCLTQKKRGRGRPKGSKDSKPRKPRTAKIETENE